jgi:hypothetical protein
VHVQSSIRNAVGLYFVRILESPEVTVAAEHHVEESSATFVVILGPVIWHDCIENGC